MKRINKLAIALGLLLTVAMSGCFSSDDSSKNDKKSTKDDFKNILVVGDSISSGYNPDFSHSKDTYGWVKMLNGEGGNGYPTPQAINLNTNLWKGYKLTNVAIAGTKASDWNSDSYLNDKGALKEDAEIIVVYLGGNDFLGYIRNDGVITAEEEAAYEQNLKGIMAKLKAKYPNAKYIMPNYYDLFDGKSPAFVMSTDSAIKAMATLSPKSIIFNNIIKKVAEENKATYIDVYSEFYGHFYGKYIIPTEVKEPSYSFTALTNPPEIHPNSLGHAKIEAMVYSALKQIYDAE